MSGVLPLVSAADAIDDVAWFDRHPRRRYRARRGEGGLWPIRKVHDDVYLRTISGTGEVLADTDAELGPNWFAAARPQLSFPKANRESRQAGVRHAGGRR